MFKAGPESSRTERLKILPCDPNSNEPMFPPAWAEASPARPSVPTTAQRLSSVSRRSRMPGAMAADRHVAELFGRLAIAADRILTGYAVELETGGVEGVAGFDVAR